MPGRKTSKALQYKGLEIYVAKLGL